MRSSSALALPSVALHQSATVTPSVTASAYSSGQCLGGVMTLTPMSMADQLSALLHHLLVTYGAPSGTPGNMPSGTLLIFSANPSTYGATCTDTSAFAFGSSLPYLVAAFGIGAGNFVTINGVGVADFPAVGQAMKAAANQSLYAVFVLDGTSLPTPTATNVLTLRAKFLPIADN